MKDRRHSFNKRTFYKKRRFERTKPFEHQLTEGVLAGFWSIIKWPFLRHRAKKAELKKLDKEKVKKRWTIVEDLYKKSDFRAVIIEADKIMEYTLEHLNFEGNNYAERLKSAQHRFSKSVFDSLWEARRSRNRVIHEMEHEINSFEAKNVKDKIKRALKELNV
ncbi:hypothetical protein KJ713_03545 [Patescibacteria group bacterium]|nr:hypothetical protein [Patescibacteria group bacterium]